MLILLIRPNITFQCVPIFKEIPMCFYVYLYFTYNLPLFVSVSEVHEMLNYIFTNANDVTPYLPEVL